MTQRRALSLKNTPRRLSLLTPAFWWLFADRFDPSPMAWGFIYAFIVILVLVQVIDFVTAKDVEI